MFAIAMYFANKMFDFTQVNNNSVACFVVLMSLMSFTLRFDVCQWPTNAICNAHRIVRQLIRITKQNKTISRRRCDSGFHTKSKSSSTISKMLATTANNTGIPDKAWQPNFVVIETS